MNKEFINKEDINKVDINKEDINKVDINKEDVDKENKNKEDTNKQEINKKDINKENINKEDKINKNKQNNEILINNKETNKIENFDNDLNKEDINKKNINDKNINSNNTYNTEGVLNNNTLNNEDFNKKINEKEISENYSKEQNKNDENVQIINEKNENDLNNKSKKLKYLNEEELKGEINKEKIKNLSIEKDINDKEKIKNNLNEESLDNKKRIENDINNNYISNEEINKIDKNEENIYEKKENRNNMETSQKNYIKNDTKIYDINKEELDAINKENMNKENLNKEKFNENVLNESDIKKNIKEEQTFKNSLDINDNNNKLNNDNKLLSKIINNNNQIDSKINNINEFLNEKNINEKAQKTKETDINNNIKNSKDINKKELNAIDVNNKNIIEKNLNEIKEKELINKNKIENKILNKENEINKKEEDIKKIIEKEKIEKNENKTQNLINEQSKINIKNLNENEYENNELKTFNINKNNIILNEKNNIEMNKPEKLKTLIKIFTLDSETKKEFLTFPKNFGAESKNTSELLNTEVEKDFLIPPSKSTKITKTKTKTVSIINKKENNNNIKNKNNNYLTTSKSNFTLQTNPESNRSNVLINFDLNHLNSNELIDNSQSIHKILNQNHIETKIIPETKDLIIEEPKIELNIQKPQKKIERKKKLPSFKKENDFEEIKSQLNNKNKYYIKEDEILFPFIIEPFKNQENFRFFVSGNIPQLNNWDHENKPIELKSEYKNGKKFFTTYIPIDNFGNKIWVGKPFLNFHPPLEIFNVISNTNDRQINIFNLNIRYFNYIDNQNIWDNRKDHMIKILLNNRSDICLFQEMTRIQFDYIDREIGSIYESLGYYRDSDEKSEKCGIAYNKLKFTLNGWGQFWLSSTPYVPGSNDFCNCFPRICTWASLKKIEDEDFLIFNIHLDHINLAAHVNCIKVVLQESEKIIKHHSKVKFVLLAGCFYCEEDDPIVNILCNHGYKELRFEKTFHDFTGIANRHWDFMFYKENKIKGVLNKEFSNKEMYFNSVKVLKEESIINEKEKIYVSDHFPILAEFNEI